MRVTTNLFGKMPDGKQVMIYHFESAGGLKTSITNYGGIITSIRMPDRDGKTEEITMGFPGLEPYLGEHPYFGAIVGRYANRIAGGTFSIGGKEYQLSRKGFPYQLHGGINGFDKKFWDHRLEEGESETRLILTYRSKHLEEGYPGKLDVTVTYILGDDNSIRIEFLAEPDASTHVNLTNHAYFNLGGFADDVFAHQLWLDATHVLEFDEHSIPTGKRIPCSESAFHFVAAPDKQPQTISIEMDNCFVLSDDRRMNKEAAILYHPASGRKLTVFGTQPSIQIYTANFLDGTIIGHDNQIYKRHMAVCLESQHFPNTPNTKSFPTTLIKAGEKYQQSVRWLFETV